MDANVVAHQQEWITANYSVVVEDMPPNYSTIVGSAIASSSGH